MAKNLKTEDFIKRGRLKHGEHYDYTLSNYVNAKTKIKMRCIKHDLICEADPFAHFDHHSCKKCSYEQTSLKQTFTNEMFINKARSVHGNKYDYSKVEYVKAKINICIICPEHGEFWQTPDSHTSKRKRTCPKCSKIAASLRNSKSTSEFINQCLKVHKNKYSYEKTEYKCDKCKVIITCPKHGDFEQSPTHHIQGKGCLKCAREATREYNRIYPNGWNHTNWENKAKISKNFDGFKVYIIRCWNEDEEFYKIGRTFQTVKRRFTPYQMPYNYELLKQFYGTSEEICDLEFKLKRQYKKFKYRPIIPFEGQYECFKELPDYDTL